MPMYADNGLGYALGPNGYAEAGYGSSGYGIEGAGLVSIPKTSDGFVDINLFTPATQSFPTTPAECGAVGFSTALAALWGCQDGSGSSTIGDASGNGVTLTKAGTIATGQKAVGLHDGTAYNARSALEFTYPTLSNDVADAPNASLLDFNWTTRFSFLIVFRAMEATALTAVLLAKGTFPGAGYGLYNDGSGAGTLTVQIRDSIGNSAGISTSAGGLMDGAWHWVYVQCDPIADTVSITTDQSNTSSISTAALVNTSAPADKFRLGTWAGAGGAMAAQIAWGAFFNDAATTVTAIKAWWTQSKYAPAITFARASTFQSIVGDDATTGDIVAGFALNAPAMEYSAAHTTSPRKLGWASYAAATNLIPNTDVNDGVNWATGGGTRATYDKDSSRGFREGSKHTKTAAGDKVLAAAANGASVTAATTYTASAWCFWDGIGTAPELRVYRADGTTLIGTTSATVNTSKWRRLVLTFVAPATEAVRVAWSGAAAASSAGGAWFALPMLNLGANAYPWILTRGGTASTVAPTQYVTSVPGINGDALTMVAWLVYAWTTDPNQRGAATVTSGVASLVNGRSIHLTNGGLPLGASYDGAGAPIVVPILGVPITGGVESKITGRFDRSKRNGYSARIEFSGSAVNDGTAAPVGAAIQIVYFGSLPGGVHMNGSISRVRLYRRIEAVAA